MNQSFIIAAFLSISLLAVFFLNIDSIFKKKKEPLAELISFEGKVSSRPTDLTIWKPAKKNQQFFSGDVIATERSSKAEISFFEGKRILLDENSQVVIKAQKQSSKEEMISIRLIKGQVETKFVKSESTEKKDTRKVDDSSKKFALISGQSTLELSNSELKVQKQEGKKVDIQVQSGEAKLLDGLGDQKKINVLTNVTNPVLLSLTSQPAVGSPKIAEKIPDVAGLNLNVELSQIPIKIEELAVESPSSGYYFATVSSFSMPLRISKTRNQTKDNYEIVMKINDDPEKSFISSDEEARINISLPHLMNKVRVYVRKKGFRNSKPIELEITSLYQGVILGKWVGISGINKTTESAVFRQKSFKKPDIYMKFKDPNSLRHHSSILKNSETIVLSDSIRDHAEDFHLVQNASIDATLVTKRDLASAYAMAIDADLMFFGKEDDLIQPESDTQTTIAKHFLKNEKIYLAGHHNVFLLKRKLFEKFPNLSLLFQQNIKAAFKDKIDVVWIRK